MHDKHKNTLFTAFSIAICFFGGSYALGQESVFDVDANAYDETLQSLETDTNGDGDALDKVSTTGKGGGSTDAIDPGGGGGGDPTPYESELGIENLNKLKLQQSTGAETTDLLGESIDLNTGGLSFSQTDVSIPGNSSLEVAIHRRFKGKSAISWQDTHQFENWLLDLPYIHTNQVHAVGGTNGWSGTWAQGNECAGDMISGVMVYQGIAYAQDVWWTGDTLNVPGQVNDKLLMNNGTGVIASAVYPKVTASNWRISCINRYEGGVLVGQGFKAESPDGKTYTFAKFRRVQTSWAGPMARYDSYMLVTKVEDRYGNYVNYNYAGDNLTSIVANDGRTITLQYGNSSRPHRITSVTANGRVWTYGYSGTSYLTTVTRPDGKSWVYGLNYMNYTSLPQTDRFCSAFGSPSATITVKHPNGALGTFTVTSTRHGRINVPEKSYPVTGEKLNSKCFWTFAVTKKVLTGPGLPTMQWNYSYSQNWGTWAGQSSGFTNVDLIYPQGFPATTTARSSKTTTVVAPDGSKTVHFFNRDYGTALEGKETATDQYDTNGTTLLSRHEMTYQQSTLLGFTRIDDDNAKPHEYRVNLTKDVLYLYKSGGTEKYTKELSQYDVHGTPSKIREYNDFGSNQRYTLLGYRDGTSAWILNQPTTVKVSATDSSYTTSSETTYDSQDRPYEERRFGRWFRRFTSYHTTANQIGLPKRITYNATNRWVEYSNYKRGTAQTIMTPQSLSTTPQYAYLTVDNNGWTTKTIDFEGNTVNFGYDGLGRIILIDPVDAAWANTTVSYPTATGSEGLAYVSSGMPKTITTTGNHKQTQYLDALLRPIISADEDTSVGLARYSRTAYNAYGNPVFTSFAVDAASSTADTADGTEITYDGLQRTKNVQETTNAGNIVTTYVAGNKIQVNDYKGYVTTTTYLAYGTPATDLPTLIAQPLGVNTAMDYNIFGNMTEATQGGITQYNVYDGYQNLCKIVRPDSGNEAFGVDAVGQVTWSGKGTSVDSSPTTCDTAVTAAAKVTNTYDNLGNIRLVNYGDASPDKTYTYDKNSRLKVLAAGTVATTTITYNSAGLPTSETLATGGTTFGVGYGYNSLGNLTSVTYPSSSVIAFAPNAFGEARTAGAYAHDIDYHPNGTVASLTYGNSRVYTTTQNARRLPEYVKVMSGSTTISNLRYQYDANSNVNKITDSVTSVATRTLGYDSLDRLSSASGLWGTGSYSYDVLGNILTKTEGGNAMVYHYNTSLNRLTSITGANARTFSYDSYGNVTANGLQGFTYNLAGQMIGSTLPTVSYAYDGFDRRAMRTEGGQTAYTMYSMSGQLLYKSVGGVASEYIYAGSMLVAEKQGSSINYIHTDLLGSPIDGRYGSTSYTENYSPWGEKLDNPIQMAGDVGYTGHQSDAATGLTYAQARYYDPVIGRFLSSDPMPFNGMVTATFNCYAYVLNNPFRYVDPFGWSAEDSEPPEIELPTVSRGQTSGVVEWDEITVVGKKTTYACDLSCQTLKRLRQQDSLFMHGLAETAARKAAYEGSSVASQILIKEAEFIVAAVTGGSSLKVTAEAIVQSGIKVPTAKQAAYLACLSLSLCSAKAEVTAKGTKIVVESTKEMVDDLRRLERIEEASRAAKY